MRGYHDGAKGHKCEYGIPVIGNGGFATGDFEPCGKPSVYQAVGANDDNGYFCEEHAPEVAASDEATYGD